MEPITFVATFRRNLLGGLLLIAAGALLSGIWWSDRERPLVYFVGLPLVGLGILGTIFFAARKPPRLTIDGDTLIAGARRYPFVEVVVGEIAWRVHNTGSVVRRYRAFDVTMSTPEGKMINLTVSDGNWPEFDRMHGLLTQAAAAPAQTNSK